MGGTIVVGYVAAVAALPGRPFPVRWCGALAVQLVVLQLLFVGLGAIDGFTGAGGAAAVTVLLVATIWPARCRHTASRQVRADAGSLRRWLSDTEPAARVVLAATAALAVVMLVRTLVTPPLAWDDLTYHLVKAGSWAGAGGFAATPAPDAWRYYDYFAGGGELVTSWALLPAPSGALLGLLALHVWLGIAVAAFAAARSLGTSRSGATLAACAVTTVPAVAAFAESAYVDNLLVLCFLAGFVGVQEARRGASPWVVLVASATFGLGAGIKQSFLPVAALGWVWLVVIVARADTGGGRVALRRWGALVLGAAVAAPWYLRAWIDRGSPLFPFRVPVVGERLASSDTLADVVNGTAFGRATPSLTAGELVGAFLDSVDRLGSPLAGLNWPPLPSVWLVLGAVGAVTLSSRSPRLRAPVAFLVVGGAAVWVQLLLPESQMLRLAWGNVLGRLLLPALAAAVLLATAVRGRWVQPVSWCLVAGQITCSWLGLFDSWSGVDGDALRDLGGGAVAGLALLLLAIAAVVSSWRASPSKRWAGFGVAAVSAVLSVGLLGATVGTTRSAFRYRYYEASADLTAWRLHDLGTLSCSWPLWQAVDGSEGHRVLVTAGFGPPAGHNNARAPFLGSELQNTLVYAPITSDGAIVDLADDGGADRLDEAAWLARVHDEGADYVAVLAPSPPEQAVIDDHPERFERVASSACPDTPSTLYRVQGP
jgi:hypothetical protein